MRIFRLILLSVPGLLFLLSCNSQPALQAEPPPGLLDEETFTRVLTDFALAESAANMNVKGVDYRKQDSVYAFDPLADYHIRPSQYDSTVSFYVQRPDLYKKIYENVLAQLSEIQARRNTPATDSSSR
jgi:hypothetical protein